ncbi:MAG: DUF1573 domain-containing protein [Phycisphaerales bacterium]|nr:DUF1573 domain-containing protein [Phycisphaerales bacterium]
MLKADPEDFGEVSVGTSIIRTVTFINKRTVPITLEIVDKTCGCLVTSFEPATVPPGGRTLLRIATVPAPGSGVQAHHVTFTSTWDESGFRRSERGVCGLSFVSDVEFVVRPEAAALACVVGRETHVDIFVRYMEDEGGKAPPVNEPQCSLPGWSVRRVDDATIPKGVVRLRATGSGDTPGFFEGEVMWDTESATQPEMSVPIRLRVLEPWRSVPGGAVFTPAQGDERRAVTMTLFPRVQNGGKPVSVELEGGRDWINAALSSEREVTVELLPHGQRPPTGSVYARLLDGDGNVLLRFPVVWFAESDIRLPAR